MVPNVKYGTYFHLMFPAMIRGVPLSPVDISGGWRWPSRSPTGHWTWVSSRWDFEEPYESWRKITESIWNLIWNHIMSTFIYLPNFEPIIFKILGRNSPISPFCAQKGSEQITRSNRQQMKKNVAEIPEVSSLLKIGQNPEGKGCHPTIILQGLWLLVWGILTFSIIESFSNSYRLSTL